MANPAAFAVDHGLALRGVPLSLLSPARAVDGSRACSHRTGRPVRISVTGTPTEFIFVYIYSWHAPVILAAPSVMVRPPSADRDVMRTAGRQCVTPVNVVDSIELILVMKRAETEDQHEQHAVQSATRR